MDIQNLMIMRITHVVKAFAFSIVATLASLAFAVVPAYAASVAVQSVSPNSTLIAGQTLTFTAVGSGFSGSLSYYVFDDFANTSLTSAAINVANGGFTWTPNQGDIGVHNLTIEATDGSGLITTAPLMVTVNSQYSLAVQSLSASTVTTGQTVTFTVVPTGFTPTSYSINDTLYNNTLTSSNISASGAFSWTPTSADVGSHAINITGTDSSGHTGKIKVSVVVNAPQATNTATTNTTTNSTTPAVTTTTSSSAGLTSQQIAVVTALLQSFNASPSAIQQVAVILAGSGSSSSVSSSGSSSGSGYVFTSLLTIGSSGAEVTALQNRLAALGYFSGTASGYFGSVTQAAVKAFQTAHGIAALGYTGPATRAALNGN